MSKSLKPASRFLSFRRLWKPGVAVGTGGTAIAIWFDEIVIFGEELLALIFLPLMAGIIYLLDIFIFKSRMPRPEDLEKPAKSGEKK